MERKAAEIRKLKQKVGELVMDVDVYKEVQRRLKEDFPDAPVGCGDSSTD